MAAELRVFLDFDGLLLFFVVVVSVSISYV